MVRDRYKELLQQRKTGDNDDSGKDTIAATHSFDGGYIGPAAIQGNDVIIEMGSIDSDIGRFLKQVDSLKERVISLKGDVEKIKYLQGSLLDSLTRDEAKEVELDRLMTSVKAESKDLMGKLKEMEKANLATLERMEASEITLTRIQKVQHGSLLKSFSELLDYYQEIQIDYQDKCKARVRTMLAIRNGNVESEDQLNLDDDEFLENGNISVFTDSYQERTEEARQELALADARLNDLRKIETALQDLHDLFIEMSRLVVLQGETIDSIEKNVNEAKEFVSEADSQLANAIKLQSSARKKKIIIIIVIFIILIVLGIIIYVSIPKGS